jgi:hypothetical protein
MYPDEFESLLDSSDLDCYSASDGLEADLIRGFTLAEYALFSLSPCVGKRCDYYYVGDFPP